MTATTILSAPKSHPLFPVDTISKSAERRAELQRIEEEITGAAVLAGWKRPRRRVCSRGHSIYVQLKLGNAREVRIRISDHAMSRPAATAEDIMPLFIVTLEVPGAISHCIAWLERTATEHRERVEAEHPGTFTDAA